jgi:hypothetical protein
VPDVATQAYYTWLNAGKPWRLARPIAELAELAKQHPEITLVGTIGDLSHLTDATPEDHTPFSIDEWPESVGEYVVCAVDFGGDPEAIAEMCAKALRDKPGWLKYMIWNGPGAVGLRDVRYGWRQQSASGHTSHAHFSIRTDWIDRSIGDYQLTEDDMEPSTNVPLSGTSFMRTEPDFADRPSVQNGLLVQTCLPETWGYAERMSRRQIPQVLAGQQAILAAVAGQDVVAAVRDELAKHEAAEAARDAELLDLVRQGQSGELAAEEVMRLIGERLTAPAAG